LSSVLIPQTKYFWGLRSDFKGMQSSWERGGAVSRLLGCINITMYRWAIRQRDNGFLKGVCRICGLYGTGPSNPGQTQFEKLNMSLIYYFIL
jgi:hypothetical protein